MPKTKTGSVGIHGFTWSADYGAYLIKLPKSMADKLSNDTYEIHIDEKRNLYFCKQYERCTFCGKQSKDYIFGKPVCRSCMLRIKKLEFDDKEG